jgi:hypothetical protein
MNKKVINSLYLNQFTMETIKQTLFTGWHFMRWLRLAFGIFSIIQAIEMHDSLIGAIGGFFLFTAVINTGCCSAGGCATPMPKDAKESA